jgi:hypothetical protein
MKDSTLIPNFSRYTITKDGVIRNLKGHIMSQHNNGYMETKLMRDSDNKRTTCQIHRLVASTYIPNPNNLPQVNHKNGDRMDNRIDNLEWITRKGNIQHSEKLKLRRIHKKQVIQLTVDNTPIAEFESIAEAERLTGVDHRHISRVCNGNGLTAKGFKWEFKDKEIKKSRDFDQKIDALFLESRNWKKIPKYEGRISRDGRVYSDKYKMIRKLSLSKKGYQFVSLGKIGSKTVHRLVATVYIPNSCNYPHVNHKNGIKDDNRVENLEWCTRSQNAIHAHETGLTKTSRIIIQYNFDKEIVKVYPSMAAAARSVNISPSAIAKAVKNKRPSSGFLWRFENEPLEEDFLVLEKWMWRNRGVIQYDENMLEINRFNSITDAQKHLRKRLHITDVCEGNRNTSGGYVWRWQNFCHTG